jgi:hypothetical protein
MLYYSCKSLNSWFSFIAIIRNVSLCTDRQQLWAMSIHARIQYALACLPGLALHCRHSFEQSCCNLRVDNARLNAFSLFREEPCHPNVIEVHSAALYVLQPLGRTRPSRRTTRRKCSGNVQPHCIVGNVNSRKTSNQVNAYCAGQDGPTSLILRVALFVTVGKLETVIWQFTQLRRHRAITLK